MRRCVIAHLRNCVVVMHRALRLGQQHVLSPDDARLTVARCGQVKRLERGEWRYRPALGVDITLLAELWQRAGRSTRREVD